MAILLVEITFLRWFIFVTVGDIRTAVNRQAENIETDEFAELWKSCEVKSLIQFQLGKKKLLPQQSTSETPV